MKKKNIEFFQDKSFSQKMREAGGPKKSFSKHKQGPYKKGLRQRDEKKGHLRSL